MCVVVVLSLLHCYSRPTTPFIFIKMATTFFSHVFRSNFAAIDRLSQCDVCAFFHFVFYFLLLCSRFFITLQSDNVHRNGHEKWKKAKNTYKQNTGDDSITAPCFSRQKPFITFSTYAGKIASERDSMGEWKTNSTMKLLHNSQNTKWWSRCSLLLLAAIYVLLSPSDGFIKYTKTKMEKSL